MIFCSSLGPSWSSLCAFKADSRRCCWNGSRSRPVYGSHYLLWTPRRERTRWADAWVKEIFRDWSRVISEGIGSIFSLRIIAKKGFVIHYMWSWNRTYLLQFYILERCHNGVILGRRFITTNSHSWLCCNSLHLTISIASLSCSYWRCSSIWKGDICARGCSETSRNWREWTILRI